MAGYKTLPGTIVNTIKSLLKERYKQGFPIIKEIIQNANDGGATTLDFGIVQGLDQSVNHPLLRVPALFFLNNGTFTPLDQEAIACFGIDANAKDRGKIGKFGLGQKSIFHFCEAFFYIARSIPIPKGCGEFINPWATPDGKDSKRPEWIELSQADQQALENYLLTHHLVSSHNPQYFLLWVPLRKRMGDERCILANYCNDANSVQENLPPDMEVRIGQLLPLLKHLKTIRFFIEKNSRHLEQQFSVSLDDNLLSRCIYPNNQIENIESKENKLQGKVSLSSENIKISFAGIERVLPAQDFTLLLGQNPNNISQYFWTDLQQSPFWSKRSSINEYGDNEIVPDKSIPHCAVVFTQQPLRNKLKAKLTLQWSVFLPLASEDNHLQQEEAEQEAHEEIGCNGDKNYTLFLHGYFFLDSGRKYIEGLQKIRTGSFLPKTPDKEDEMIAQWNYLLATRGTLRLILPSLKYFAEKHQLSDIDISNLCSAIFKSRLFNSEVYRESICAEYQWIFRTQPSNNGWELIPVDASLRSLPGIPPKWEAFPKLQELAQEHFFIIQDKPNLLSLNSNGKWNHPEICSIIDSLDPELIFSNPDYLRYLTQFLNLQENFIQQPEVQTSLIKFLRNVFSKNSLSSLQGESLQLLVKQLISKVSPHQRFKVARFEADPKALDTIFNHLYQQNLNLLLVYEPFEVSQTSQGVLTLNELISLLTALSYFFKVEPSSYKLTCEIICQLLSSSREIEPALDQLQDLPLFIGYNHRLEKQALYKYKLLKIINQSKCLFKGKWKTPISRALKEALPNSDLIFIDSRLASILSRTSSLRHIPECNARSCLELLATQPDLAHPNQRTNLLKELIHHV
ncbi:sacsin N-terminal ATP-binding-like domain-containing protein [Planktothrix mougeotii]|uniref:Sacsin/Nov domain-containing protein n=1 Tax=Planktothrix mougeotii LEGE 06226 TaxID=1828728 RepID=A0ABR9UE35_9CYAN|nr:hypothetical protein [Planktothrix mougeotii]MBE9144091.1 hypothetical protein [Planktothrix mougeotii LEGE 06226]